jgi:hypothetical protein
MGWAFGPSGGGVCALAVSGSADRESASKATITDFGMGSSCWKECATADRVPHRFRAMGRSSKRKSRPELSRTALNRFA